MRVMAAEFVGGVPAVVGEVAELRAVDAVAVGALELRIGVARLDARGAQRHVVLVGPVAAVVYAVTYLVPDHKHYAQIMLSLIWIWNSGLAFVRKPRVTKRYGFIKSEG